MAVNNTGAMFKSFEFDGTDSRDFGVYITGAAVYDAPEREVEMISIPNRNGAFALDKGRFENIEITYPAGIYADTEADFAEAISDLRNFLCSKRGYCRLTDEYNPNEYRMAIYKSGLEVEPALLKAGEFEITFECMPQRFLTSGETEITVSNGQTITNPTRFDAKPLIKAVGNGSIDFNNHRIMLVNTTVGALVLGDGVYAHKGNTSYDTMILPLDLGLVDNGDAITITNLVGKITYVFNSAPTNVTYTVYISDIAHTVTHRITGNSVEFTFTLPSIALAKGTFNKHTIQYDLNVTVGGQTYTGILTFETIYQGTVYGVADYKMSIGFYDLGIPSTISGYSVYVSSITAVSTQTSLGNPTYIDCEEGEAYKYVDNRYVGINNYVSFGAELPTLAPGANTVTKTNTITSLKIVPRWWRV